MAFVLAVGAAAQLVTGQLRLPGGPPDCRQVDRQTDPGRFWVFFIGTSLVAVALAIDGSFHLI